jgi:hypothetical protein
MILNAKDDFKNLKKFLVSKKRFWENSIWKTEYIFFKPFSRIPFFLIIFWPIQKEQFLAEQSSLFIKRLISSSKYHFSQ